MKLIAIIKKILSPIFDLSSFIFPFVLISYLLLFLLENVFPGFVSNTFDFNLLLFSLFIFGILSVFYRPQILEEKYNKKNDYLSILVISFVAFIILFYENYTLGIDGIIITVGSTFIIIFLSLIIFVYSEVEDENVTEKRTGKVIESFAKPIKRTFPSFPIYKPAFVIIISLLVVTLIFFVLSNKQPKQTQYKLEKSDKPVAIKEQAPDQNKEKMISRNMPDQEHSTPLTIEKLTKTSVVISRSKNSNVSSSSIIKLFSEKRVKLDKIVNIDDDYTNAIIRFKPEDESVALYLVYILQDIYPIIEKAPLSPGNNSIILILGEKK